MGRETGREKLEFENLPAKRGYFGQKHGGFRALGPGHTDWLVELKTQQKYLSWLAS